LRRSPVTQSALLSLPLFVLQQAHFSTLLAGQPADDPDRLVDASGVAEAQVRVVPIAFANPSRQAFDAC